MALFETEGLVALVLFFFWVWALLDVIATDPARCRNLPKGVWVVLVLILPDIGAIAWLLLGRPEGAGFALGGERTRRQPSYRGSGPYHENLAPRYLDDYQLTDRRSQELDAQLDDWERRKQDLDAREAALRERERALESHGDSDDAVG